MKSINLAKIDLINVTFKYKYIGKHSYANKNSDILSQNLVKKQIQTTVEYLSQNGYISFSNFLQALYLLKITN
jgi:hypothetical protein